MANVPAPVPDVPSVAEALVSVGTLRCALAGNAEGLRALDCVQACLLDLAGKKYMSLDKIRLANSYVGTHRGGTHYNMRSLIESILLSHLLRCAGSLKKVLKRSLFYVLGQEATEIARMIDDETIPVPSEAALSRARVKLDMLMMLEHREEFARQGRVFATLSADASPQGNKEWFMILMDTIPRENARAVGLSDLRLLPARASALEERTLPPTLLGSGKAGLANKFCNLVHALQLEASCQA
jgi:hypothetical protein